MLSGSITALITPFKNGAVDGDAFQRIVEWQIASGTHGLVPCGTTGEAPTLTDAEQTRLTALCVEAAANRVPVIAGCGSNNTAHAIELTRAAESAGATHALHAAPYYNKPTQQGLYQHFKAIHDATGLPIILYNIPGRSVVNISDETMARLAKLPRIIGVKDATGDIVRPQRTRLSCGKSFVQLTGEDANVLPFLLQGGHGCISVTSNIAPCLCADMHKAWQKGDWVSARGISEKLLPLHDALFSETSPGPAKFAAHLLGLCQYELRLPLTRIARENERKVELALAQTGVKHTPVNNAVLVPL